MEAYNKMDASITIKLSRLLYRYHPTRGQYIFWFDNLIDDVFGCLSWDSGWIRINDDFIFQYRTLLCPPRFSERYGYTKFLNLGLIRVRIGYKAAAYE